MDTVSLSVRLLGSGSVTRDGDHLDLSAPCRTLLAFLLLQRDHRAHRSRLVDLLAHDQPAEFGRRRLNTAVWRLRRSLEPDGHPRPTIIVSDGDGLTISPDCAVWVDVSEFELGCRRSKVPAAEWRPGDAEAVTTAVDMYRGDLLEGAYDEWVLEQRARLADLHTASLVRLAQWHRRNGAMNAAVGYAERAVATEPLREDLHRMMISVYSEAGLHDLAIRQFDRCRQILADELGVDPLPETVRLVTLAARRPVVDEQHLDLAALVADLEAAQAALSRLSGLVERSISALRPTQ